MQPIRVLLAKPGLDMHDRGVRVVARVLRDAGMDVIYLGPSPYPRTEDGIVASAIQEDADIIGLSFHSPTYFEVVPHIARLLRKKGLNMPLVVGGIIPDVDRELLMDHGAAAIFGPASDPDNIVRTIRALSESQKV